MTWHPIATLSINQREERLFFWCVPKTTDETYHDTSGNPILSDAKPYRHEGKYGTWDALSKATHWMELPNPPTEAQA